MGAMTKDRQSHFFKWLSRTVSSSQLTKLEQAFTDLEDFLATYRYMYHLSRRLVETDDAEIINQLYSELKASQRFMRLYRADVMLMVLQYYARYLSEDRLSAKNELPQAVICSGDPLIERLKKDSIPYVDYRMQKGALWIAKSPKTDAFIKEALALGVHFKFSELKQQWWTSDVIKNENICSETINPAVVDYNRKAFSKWLKGQNLNIVDEFAIYGTIRKIHLMLQDNSISLGLLGVSEIDKVRKYASFAMQMTEFISGDQLESQLWTRALNCYLRFAESEYFSSRTSVTESAKSELNKSFSTGTVFSSYIKPITEKPTVSVISEDNFREWLMKNKPSEHVDAVIESIRSAEKFAQYTHMQGIRIFNDKSSTMQLSIKQLLNNRMFTKYNSRLYKDFTHAASLLLEYNSVFLGIVQDKLTPKVVSATNATKVSDQSKRDAIKPSLEPSLLHLLQGEEFAVLREVLVRKGILTLESFRGINLWTFMNQNGLYSIGQRLTVYSAIQRALADENKAETIANYKLITREREYSAPSPAGVLIDYCRTIATKYPLRFRGLIGQCMSSTDVVPLSRAQLHASDLHLDNPEVYINSKINADTAQTYARWIGTMCRDNDLPQVVTCIIPTMDDSLTTNEEVGSEKKKYEPGVDDGRQVSLTRDDYYSFRKPQSLITVSEKESEHIQREKPAISDRIVKPSALQQKVEQLVLEADLEGMTLDQLYEMIPAATMVALKQIRDNSIKLVEISDRLIHVDAFVDWDEGAQKLEEILEKLLAKNNGYVSSAQLYEYVRAEMQMVLNDNDMDDPRKVFDMAEHLFEKEKYHGKLYTFWMKTHISRSRETVTSNLDVIRKYARDHNGFFRYDDLLEYLERVGIKTGNLRGQMQLGNKPIFFYYSSEEIISAESMGIDDSWLEQAGKALGRLFADVGDHIVLRSINPIWYEQMPTLPGYLPWTPLLLQYILQFYGEKLGAKTIGSELNQKYDVLHAMLVTPDSEIQTFADAVVAYLVDSGIPERQFEAEELRGRLVDGGLITGNELILHMPKAIGSDPRFAWNASGGRVSINV